MAKLDSTLDLCFAALSDPTRRAILHRLARGRASVGELAAPHDMALPSFMAHLRRLEQAGLILTHKEGRTRICTLAPGAFAPARTWLSEQAAIWEGRLDRFDDYIATLTKDPRE